MTELLSGVEAPSDAELISRVRGGDVGAYGQLFSRHVDAARRLGRQLVRGHDVDDLVSDAFAKTLQVLQSGGGPDVAFRAYLLTSVRRLHVDRIRASKKVQPTDDMTVYDDGLPFNDTAVANFENGAAAKAFSSLPERWQLVLWHLEVEGQKPAEIAPLLGMSANSVSALAYRAREGLRQAFLTMHLADCATEQCRWVNEHLGAYVRKGLSRRDTTKVEEHLDECRRCTAMYLELDEVNSNLAGIIAPLLLGAAAAGYVSSAGAGLTGVSGFIGRIRDALSGDGGAGSASTASSAGGAGSAGGAASAGATAAAGSAAATGSIVTAGGMITAGGVVAAGVAAVTTAALVLGGGPKDVVTEADQPVGIVQAPPSAPGADGDATGEGGAAGQGDNPDSDTTLISPDEERQGDAGPETDGADGDATGLKTDGTDSDSETTDGSGTGAAPAPGDAPAQEPAEDPNDGQQDGPQNQPGGEPGGDPGGPDDGPGGDDGPGDLPLPVDPPKLPEVEVPLPPVEVPLPPVETPDRGNADSPGAGDGTNPDNGSGSGDANDGTDGGTESGTGGGPGRSDGERGGGNDNVSPPDTGNGSNSGSGPATEPQQDPAPPGDAGGQTGGGQDGDTQPGETGGQTGGGQEGDPGTGDTGGDAGGDTDGDTPVVVPTELSISDLAIIDGLLVLDVAGDPVLPSAVTVTLTSDPAGVTFGQGGTCQVTGNTAVCPTVPDFLGAGLLTLRAMSDGAPTLRAAIPLEIPADLESASLRFTVSSADATVSGQTSTTMELGSDDEAPPADTGDASPEDETLPDEDETPADEDDPAEVEDPETNEFGFVGDPVVTQVGSGGERHRYTVRVELTGVADGDLVTLRLLDSQTRFCDDVDCSPSPGSDEERSARERVVAVALSEGQKRFVYEFDAWLPGGASVSLCATRGDEASSNCEADTGEPVASEPSAKKSSGR